MDELATILIATLPEVEAAWALETEALGQMRSRRQLVPGGPHVECDDAPRLTANPIQSDGNGHYMLEMCLAPETVGRLLGQAKAAEHANYRARCVRDRPPGPPEWAPVPPKKDK